MNPDLQIVRAGILTEAHRPTPEPDEAELRRIAEHIGTSPEATTTEATTTEATTTEATTTEATTTEAETAEVRR